ncbi:hypothetical protein L7F22_025088 [Adiantum nelumboides]|nr:hypothetical protein [Adiantum nelumboides]
MDEEMTALDVNETWELVSFPEGKKPIGCKWVYKVKHNADGSISRYKARLIAKGYAHMYGIDYEEAFSHVAKMAIVCSVIAVAASKGWLLHQKNVKNAFLHGDLQEEVYMEQPQGYEDVKQLKQEPRAWHARIVACLVSIGFHMVDADHSLYVCKNENGIVIICIYVDDLIIGDHNVKLSANEDQVLEDVTMYRQIGELRYFLGIEIIHTKEGIWLSQRQYALDMLSKYGMANCKPISIPLDQNVKFRADEGQVLEDVTMYRKPHLDVVRRTLRYVSATLDYALFYEASTELQLSGFTDANWDGSACDRRSTSGFMFSLGSIDITWSSKKQPTIALSSTEVEYRGAALAACEVAWLDLLLGYLGIQVQRSVVIHCDNLSSIQLAQNPLFHAKTKHIKVQYHFIKERVLDDSIDLTFVRTDEQDADIFMKALGAEKLRQF